jgi:hypothetical protein
MASKLVITAEQRARILEQRSQWVSLEQEAADYTRAGCTPERVAQLVDRTLAYRICWERQARRVAVDKLVIVPEQEILKVLSEM